MEPENFCPDFNLNPMKSFDPKLLMTYKPGQEALEEVDAFVITLGLIFNDLKGLYWWNKQLEKGQPKNLKEATEYVGQWSGMRIQIGRLLLGIFVELLNTINENPKPLNHPLFKKVIDNLDNTSFICWNDIVLAANQKKSGIKKNKKLFDLLQEVRSNGIFHYENIGEIHKGYKAHFFGQVPISAPEFNSNAFYSTGKNIFEMRFYFSDAAVDGYSKIKAAKYQKQHGNFNIAHFVQNSLQKIHTSFQNIIEGYIEERKSS